jgi:membrane protease subunit HflK
MSLNDPQWGKRGNSGGGGPPDLDEIWRNVNRRINELFGRKAPAPGDGDSGGGGGGARSLLPMSGVGILLALVLLVWLASGFYIVDEGRRGVVTRFGKYTETTLPGPRWHLPFPIETAELVDFSQVKTIEIGYRNSPKNKVDKEALMLTDDENIIDIQFAVQYNIKSAEDYLFNVRKPDLIVAFIAQTAMGEVVGKAKMDFALYEGREQIAKSAEKLMQEMLDRYKTGIYVQKVTLQNVQPPDKVQAAFDDAVKAGQDRERFRNEGQAYANDVVPRARGNASRLLEEANGYQAEVIQRAEGDASRFKQILVEYAKAPAVTRERLYLDMMQSVLGNVTKVIVDQKAGNSLLYLPLDKLIQQSGAASGAAPVPSVTDSAPSRPATAAPAPEPAGNLDPGRSRDALRGRERTGDSR